MQGENRMGAFWDQCFAEGLFVPLEAQGSCWSDAYAGVMHDWSRGDGNFTYTIGMLMQPGTAVPEGYVSYSWPAQKAAMAWVRGADAGDICANAHELTMQGVAREGLMAEKMGWCMEYYACPRFTEPDENGLITLDYYIPLD